MSKSPHASNALPPDPARSAASAAPFDVGRAAAGHEDSQSWQEFDPDEMGLETDPGCQQALILLVMAPGDGSWSIQQRLARLGYQQVMVVADPLMALDTVERVDPALIVLDWNLPPVGGMAVLQQIRMSAVAADYPVFMLNLEGMQASASERARALRLGAQDFVSASHDAVEWVTRLRQALTPRRAHPEATHDPRTGWSNQSLFADRVQWCLRLAQRQGLKGALLQIHVHRLQAVMQSLPEGGGEHVLMTLTDRVESCVRNTDMVAHGEQGSLKPFVSTSNPDEMYVLVLGLSTPEQAASIGQRLLDVVAAPIAYQQHELGLTASIGIAAFPADALQEDQLLKFARIAVQKAMARGGNTFQFYHEPLHEAALARLNLEWELARALERDELVLLFQPKVEVRSRRMSGAEALLRWQHPQRGLLQPDEFLPIAQESGQLVTIGEWTVRRVCEQVRRWHAAGFWVPRMAVNLASVQFQNPRFMGNVVEILRQAKMDPSLLTLEMTEATIMHDPQASLEAMQILKNAGVRVAIDDFGSGFSSLGHLRRMPIHEIKIDRCFVQELLEGNDMDPMVTGIIQLAHALGLKVVAEGVETRAQLDVLDLRGCDECQGNLFSQPISSSDFESILQKSANGQAAR